MFSPNPLFLLHTFSAFLLMIFSIIFSNDLLCKHLKQKHLTYHLIQALKLISLLLAMLCFPSCMNSEFIIFLTARFGRNRTKSSRTDDRKSDRIRMMDSDRSHVIPLFMMGRHNLEQLLLGTLGQVSELGDWDIHTKRVLQRVERGCDMCFLALTCSKLLNSVWLTMMHSLVNSSANIVCLGRRWCIGS
jgi:hypothetical protein